MARGIKVVLMGVDNSGKTTLAKNLVETLNSKGLDFGYILPLGKAPLEAQEKHLQDILFSERNLIIDRLPVIEEEVVGRTLRGGSNFDKINKAKLFEYYKNVDMFIFCNPSMEAITNWGSRPQMDGIKENAKRLQTLYKMFFFKLIKETDGMGITFYSYNWEEDLIGRDCHDIVESIVELRKQEVEG